MDATRQTIDLVYTTIREPLPDFIWEALREYSHNANAYHHQPSVLIDKLVKKHNIPREMSYLVAGIDEAIQIFALAFGKHAYVFTPAYIVYSDVEEFGGKLTRILSLRGHEYIVSPKHFPDATLIYFANPNNPAGFTSKEKVLELVQNNTQAIVAIDEAYAEFTDFSVLDQVKQYPHMAVFRSFSKAFGMAGNRVGYVVAHPEIIEKIARKSRFSNVSYLSIGAAVTALEHEKYFRDVIAQLNKRKEDFISFLTQKGLTVIPGKINAVLLKFESEDKGSAFVKYLNDHNVIVSHGNGNSNMGLDKSHVRISIGTEEQMNRIIDIINGF